MSLHTAFGVSFADVMIAPRALRSVGVTPVDFDEQPTDEPVVFAWMPAASVVFRDRGNSRTATARPRQSSGSGVFRVRHPTRQTFSLRQAPVVVTSTCWGSSPAR